MDVTINEYLGRAARDARHRLELTQAQVASRVGVATAIYGRIERGRMTPSLPTVMQMCLVLGLDANALLGFTSSTPPPWLEPGTRPVRERPAVGRLLQLLPRLTRQQVLALGNLAHAMRLPPAARTPHD